jgi:RNA polymerase subunit RPABC4/transcription elongation factor Spt4
MGFVDTVKELAEKVGDTVDKGIKTGSDSYKKMTEKSRLKKEISRLNIEINNIFATVGKKLYTDDPANKEFSKVFEAVREKQVEIEELNAQLTALEDKIQCKKCGEMISKDSRFCDKCGAKVEVPAPEPSPEPETVVAEEVKICRNCGAELIEAGKYCD